MPILKIIILQLSERFLTTTLGSHQVQLNCFKVSIALGSCPLCIVLLKRDHPELSVYVTAYVTSITSSRISIPPVTSVLFVHDLDVATGLEIVSVENLQQPFFFTSTSRFKWIFVTDEGGWTEMIRLEGNDVRKRSSLAYLVWFSSPVHWLRMEASSSFDTRMQSEFSCHGLLYWLLYYRIIFSLGFKKFRYWYHSPTFRYCSTLSHTV